MAKKKKSFKEQLLEMIEAIDDDESDDGDDSDDVITLRGPAARKLLGITDDDAGKKKPKKKDGDDSDDDEGDEGDEGDEPDAEGKPQRSQSKYFGAGS